MNRIKPKSVLPIKSLYFKFRSAEIYQKADICSCRLEIIDNLSLMFRKESLYRL